LDVLDYYNLEIVENSGVAAITNKCAIEEFCSFLSLKQ
jgi:hypothetical protein